MKRTKLSDRKLPSYCKGEEIMNMVTHIVGGGFGVIILVLCVLKAALGGDIYGCVGAAVYGVCMVTLYTMSSVYHGLKPGMAKKVMQVLDHCTIYFLIAGSYTVIALSAIDLKKYNIFSMICYIGMGWCVAFFIPQTLQALTTPGFLWLLSGGIAYTVGAVLYGVGSKKPWFHCIFHIFVVLGSLLQFVAIFLYAL